MNVVKAAMLNCDQQANGKQYKSRTKNGKFTSSLSPSNVDVEELGRVRRWQSTDARNQSANPSSPPLTPSH